MKFSTIVNKKSYKINNKEIFTNKPYLISEFTKEELEQLLVGKAINFWTKDCQLFPDFNITAKVCKIGYFNTGEIFIEILRNKTLSSQKTLQLSSRMHNLRFVILND